MSHPHYPTPTITERLEYLRGQIEAECISYSEIAELQSLAPYIGACDTILLEWAGVPEFLPEEPHYPTSAELAAMRNAPHNMRYTDCATPDELRKGIGHRCKPAGIECDHTYARRGANRLRRKAYQANEWNRADDINLADFGVYATEIEYGIPVHSPCPRDCSLAPGHWGSHPIREDSFRQPGEIVNGITP